MHRKWLILPLILVVLVAGAVLVLFLGYRTLGRELAESALPGLSLGEVEVGWNRVEARRIRYQPPGSRDVELQAEDVSLRPRFLSLFRQTLEVSSLELVSPAVSLARARDGTLALPLPAGGGESTSGAARPRPVVLEELRVRDGKGIFLDRSVGHPYARLEFDKLEAQLGPLRYPPGGRTELDISGRLQGKQPAHFSLKGWVEPGEESSHLDLEIRDLEIQRAEPYLRERLSVPLRGGRLRLKARLEMTRGLYQARGEMGIRDLQVGPGGRFLGVSSQLLGQFLAAAGPELVLPFRIEGNIHAPATFQSKLVESAAASLVSQVPALLGRQLLGGKTERKLNRLQEKARELKNLFRKH